MPLLLTTVRKLCSEQMPCDIALVTGTADHTDDAVLVLHVYRAKTAHCTTPAANCHLCAHITSSNHTFACYCHQHKQQTLPCHAS